MTNEPNRLDLPASDIRRKSPMLRSLAVCVFACVSMCASSVLAVATSAEPAGPPSYRAEVGVEETINSIGDDAMAPLMETWITGFGKQHPHSGKGARWEHPGSAAAVSALMFEIADIAPMSREPTASELAPYAHQFKGDMMKSPLLVQVANAPHGKAFIAVNRRPDSPLPPKLSEFLSYVLSKQGQDAIKTNGTFRALNSAQLAVARSSIAGYVAPLDSALASYRPPSRRLKGALSSVGSDGMKSLVDGWMQAFQQWHPAVRRGERWEHLGTLNGFQALLAGETDIAPMGRELWPVELAAYTDLRQHPPLEIRVARGGFNTPQRTTAQAIFVHADNPLDQISIPQFAAIFGPSRTITRWGQLGLRGEWTDRPIALRMPPRTAPNAMSMQMMTLGGGPWNPAVMEAPFADTAKALANDIRAIGFGGFEEGGPGLKTLAVAETAAGPYIAGTPADAASGRYPLTRYMYVRLHRPAGTAIAPHVREFLRYVLSREGQDPIRYSGYFPLSAAEAEVELAKLD